MEKERRYFQLEKADGRSLGVGYRDNTGVYFTDNEPQRYESLDELIDATGAVFWRHIVYMMPIPKEMIQVPYGIPGATRSEGLMYMILETANDYVPKEVIMQILREMIGTSGDSFYALMSRLRKKMPHSESVELKRGKGYRLVKEI